MPFFYYDQTYILIIIGVILSLLASAKVKRTYARYSNTRNHAGMTGAQVAEHILRSQGIYDVSIQHVSGELTDHYDPRKKVVRLSDSVYNSTSVAAVGVAAHECGHVIQHAKGYRPLEIRSALVPVANFGSGISWILIVAGLFIGGNSSQWLINAGILAFSLAVLFQLVTLPVEFNASGRALKILENNAILYGDELKGSEKVLKAAALTYVAAATASLLQLLRLWLLFGGGGKRND
jgi:hypothetical protein